MLIGLITDIYVDSDLYQDGKFIKKLPLVAKLSGDDYATLGKVITLKRPR